MDEVAGGHPSDGHDRPDMRQGLVATLGVAFRTPLGHHGGQGAPIHVRALEADGVMHGD